MDALQVKNLSKSFGKQKVLTDVSFSLERGEIVGFIGPNGSGKSTMMKCVANLIFPDSGEILIAGYNLFKQRNQALSQLSALIEAPGLYYNLNGWDNLRLFASLRGLPRKRVDEVIAFTGLSQALKKRASAYSMGMKQRLALGIAILTKPTFLILDEPFSGLDPHGASELRDLIKGLAAEGCGILFSSHEILEVEKTAHRNLFIKDGRVIHLAKGEQRGSMREYKLDLETESSVLALVNELKNKGLLTEGDQQGASVLITLTKPEYLSPVLTAFFQAGQKIIGIMPFVSDIENFYNLLYERKAL